MKRACNYKYLVLIILMVFYIPLGAMCNDSLLIIRPESVSFDNVKKGLRAELGDGIGIRELFIHNETSIQNIREAIEGIEPKIVLLVDNKAMRLYEAYQKTLNKSDKVIPSITIMGAMLYEKVHRLKNARLIAFEIPIATSVLSLRPIANRPISTVGLLYRERMNNYIKENIELCEKLNIRVESLSFKEDEKISKRSLKRKLAKLLENKSVDMLWIPNDIKLLSPLFIRRVWHPLIHKYKKPVVVGVKLLVQKDVGIGTLAVMPDYEQLGIQTAELVFTAMENNWQFPENTIEPPISVIKILNYNQAKKFSIIKESVLYNVDETIK